MLKKYIFITLALFLALGGIGQAQEATLPDLFINKIEVGQMHGTEFRLDETLTTDYLTAFKIYIDDQYETSVVGSFKVAVDSGNLSCQADFTGTLPGSVVCKNTDYLPAGSHTAYVTIDTEDDIAENDEIVNIETIDFEIAAGSSIPSGNIDINLTNRLKGKILLQVESLGEAWYVRPDNGKRIYLKDGAAAYNLMRDLGLGISNANLKKIQVGFEDRFECLDSDTDGLCDKLEDGLGTDKQDNDTDNDSYPDGTEVRNSYDPLSPGRLVYDATLASRLRGEILLQVEAHGEAWYILPDNNMRYYMPDGDSAYQIMRFLSLGITDADLAKIAVD